jgi:hypothetical protein
LGHASVQTTERYLGTKQDLPIRSWSLVAVHVASVRGWAEGPNPLVPFGHC